MSERKIQAVIFDWAGTVVDFGSMAPVAAFAAAFEDAGVPVSVEEIRRPMGLEKHDHLDRMLKDEAIADRWRSAHGRDPSAADVDRLYAAFNHRLLEVLPRYADPVPGAVDAIARLRSRGIKIGSNSGYAANAMALLAQAARERGFAPDCVVSASEVRNPRPAPDLSLACLVKLDLQADAPAVKVDDTAAGIEEGRNAGLPTIAVAVSGNAVGLSLDEWLALTEQDREKLRARAYATLRESRPDYIIDTVADLDGPISEIQGRRANEERVTAR